MFLRHVAAKVGWQPWFEQETENPEAERSPVVRKPTGPFVVVRLAAALERGLNEKDVRDHPTHLVQIVSRQDPGGLVEWMGYPLRRNRPEPERAPKRVRPPPRKAARGSQG